MNYSDALPHRPFRLTWPPLLFALTPSKPSFAREAPYQIDHSVWIPAFPDQVYDEFAECSHCDKWVGQFVRLESLTPDQPPDRRLYEESFTFMTVRIRMLEAERGRRWLGTVERCTLPVARQLLQEVTFEPGDNGGTNFRWRVYYTPSWVVRPFLKSVQRLFDQMFRDDTEQLAAFFRTRQPLTASKGGGPPQQAH
ncbi:MAG TPA: SRPBCC family protein [Myxococcaceae bacterium]|jgi:hypothetical protein